MKQKEFTSRLIHVVGEEGVILNPAEQEFYVNDWLGKAHGRTVAVVRPRNTAEVSAVMRLCHQSQTPVVPQGGNTGMSGGATPDMSGAQVVLSLNRMKRIHEVDPVNNTLTADAGVILAEIQQAARAVDRYFPLSLGAEGSCTIGGNLATNAGGTGVLRYGNTRDLTLGLEVVLPDGRIWNGLRGLRKDNTGYDLKDLFIGSEGSLGIITGVVLKLFAAPAGRVSAWVGAKELTSVVTLLNRLQAACGPRLSAFEMMSESSLALVTRHLDGHFSPLNQAYPYYALIELADTNLNGLQEMLQEALTSAIDDGLIDDCVVAMNEAQSVSMWRLREGISMAQVKAGKAVKHDIALPISSLATFVKEADQIVMNGFPDLPIINFGHIGDGNLHYNVLVPLDISPSLYKETTAELNKRIHDLVTQFNGSISAEHGVGTLRRDELKRYKSSVEMDLMNAIKRAIDPNQIMNPGKLL
ncbi:FAD-binding oxidoreductase [Zwartia panacis]|uniref:FAD-binding oxidoreductase n=1 Tax=Zwartia panacis TaxID=2683345 RepID=UPI0025B49CA2|nr:FAD-binding oxidoreductase [Zwartia panacis]MDN4017663.1 FAD-binding oxidoreductase [Zwartia panacis]